MGPGSGRNYDSELQMISAVPEPNTLLVLSFAALMARRRRRKVRCGGWCVFNYGFGQPGSER